MPADRRSRGPGGEGDRSGGGCRLPATVRPGDRSGPVPRGAGGGHALPGIGLFAGRDVQAMAALVQVLARTDKGEHDRAIDDWKDTPERTRDRRAGRGLSGRRTRAGRGRGVPPAPDPRRPLRRRPQDLCDLACEENAPADGEGSLRRPHGPTGPDRQARAADRRQRCRWEAGVPGRPQGQGRPGRFLGDLVPSLRRLDPRVECD